MAVVTKDDGMEPLADDDESGKGEEPRQKGRREDEGRGAGGPEGGGGGSTGPVTTTGGGFFSIYKSGQGYWTRMGTAAAAAALIALLARFIYKSLEARTKLDWIILNGIEKPGFPTIKLIITGIFVAVSAGITWFYLNKPRVVDFFIATESEMKKVNWTSRKEIIGSTKVVIIFMFMIAFFLAFVDLFFAWFFYLIKVLQKAPFT
ncbi:MAG TPA: preprotein translocase subunit SecE [Tepidisphaeraceae bacterium]|jgi:preprotein translocase SecE subunit|nr:preprotein translocase subunit SecE [Tepidisphaeraceae bacterium]HEV8608276.1 preprotein translocase subunit SecE [Tepidisphaeraceae bacterium]